MRIIQLLIVILCIALFSSACNKVNNDTSAAEVLSLSWDDILAEARGKTLHLMMWQGDPLINAYMQQYVIPALKTQYDINLRITNGQGNVIVQALLGEIEAGRQRSELDLCWINGETFYQLRQIDALFGSFTDRLPNAQYIDFANPFIGKDFQQPVEGYECPWGNVQMTIIYDSAKVQAPPMTRTALLDFVKTNPEKFTFDNHFTGLTFLKALLMDIAGGATALNGPFDETKYTTYSAELWQYVNELKPYLWRQGRSFPEAVAPMHQLFANGELWFTMSNNDCEVDNKILEGLFPNTARAYVPDFGTIQNSHYMGIPKLSANKAAAMVVCNFLISPEAQYKKMDPQVWGDGTILNINALPTNWQEKFANLPNRRYAPKRSDIQPKALPELAPEYMMRLAEDFRRYVINSF
ncbi:MAG TPA: ABC transporter substrate-binding protein [Saprospiraceae bacterium]|nr:ABC transporter substrate-binding protein [Saprospiraceae bacterium]HMP24083.1 ABC transporter substrate-binding protein [Saprospiraceae bacterium]